MCNKYMIDILNKELVPARGCTEPIAIAYAAAVARKYLETMPKKVYISCSGNIVKNAQAVNIPNTGGLKGICAAAISGIVAGDPSKKLEVIADATEEDIKEMHRLLETDFCSSKRLDTKEKFYIIAKVENNDDYVEVSIAKDHTNIVKIDKNGEILLEKDIEEDDGESGYDKEKLSFENIFKFVDEFEIEDLKELLDTQINYNMACAEEGLKNNYGKEIGVFLNELSCNSFDKAKAYAAAASEARMGGCDIPVVTNSGSGNQGITVSVPVITYARRENIDEETLYRALVLSNLVAIRTKSDIGIVSAFCGAVSASCGAGAGFTYMNGGNKKQVEYTIQNVLGNVSGIICDGAKTSCALKIASSIDAATIGHKLAMKDYVLPGETGILEDTLEKTVENVGRLGREGMAETDRVIIDMMLEDR